MSSRKGVEEEVGEEEGGREEGRRWRRERANANADEWDKLEQEKGGRDRFISSDLTHNHLTSPT